MKNRKERSKIREHIVFAPVYFLTAAFFSWLFYDSIHALIVFAPFYILFVKAMRSFGAKKRNEQMSEEFVRALVCVSTSLSAGVSPQNAFVAAASDMEKLFGKGSIITQELDVINTKTASGLRLQDAIRDMALRWNIQEIYDFSVVFSAAVKSGGDLTSVITKCTAIMESRMQAEAEAKVMIRGKQYEQRVMCAIPPGILTYLRLSSSSFIRILYHNVFGISVMTVCLAVYVLAIYLSEKIGDIKV